MGKNFEKEYPGERGSSTWRVKEFAGLRIRVVKYEPGYLADHWCKKGHIVHCLEGSFVSELETGETFLLSKGMSYVVSDDMKFASLFIKGWSDTFNC